MNTDSVTGASTLGSVLRSLTVLLTDADLPKSDDGTLASFLAPDSLCWVRRDEGLIARGEVSEFTARGPERFAQAQDWWADFTANAHVQDQVGGAGTGPVAFGSFAFSKHSGKDSRLIVPRLLIGLREGTAWLTINSLHDDVSEEEARAELAEWLAAAPQQEPSSSFDQPTFDRRTFDRPTFELATGALTEAEWMAVVAEGIQAIEERSLEKIVLARDIVARSSAPIDRSTVLRSLMERYRECWTYGVGDFVGATPEMLIKVDSGVARARVLAGTVDRAGAPDAPGYAAEMLLDSEKQRQEHEFAVRSLVRQLAPFAEDLHFPAEPFILELPNVWHLASDVSAELAAVGDHLPNSLALVEALHPTAAVCGTPRTEAGVLIRELEHFDRGPYAGPVGWLDAEGNGEWGIGLRGAVLESEQAARLYAGCGIVGASDPVAELAETWAKFRPMLQALGVHK